MLERREHFTIEFYNRITGSSITDFSDIPPDAVAFLSCIDYHSLIEPFVVEHMSKGFRNSECMSKFSITEGYARSYRRKYKLFVQRNV